MSSTHKVDNAIATIRKPKGSDAEKVSTARQVCDGIQKCPDWPNAPDIQAATKRWMSDADALEANATRVLSLRHQLAAAERKQVVLRRNWCVSAGGVTTAVTLFAAGSANKVHAFTLDVRGTSSKGASPNVPSGVLIQPGVEAGSAVVTWPRGGAMRGFVVQRATDPANVATYMAPQVRTVAKLVIADEASHATIHVRIAAIDPTTPSGLTAWSDWVTGKAR